MTESSEYDSEEPDSDDFGGTNRTKSRIDYSNLGGASAGISATAGGTT